MEYAHSARDHITIAKNDQERAAPGHRLCAGCDLQITDKYMLEVLDKTWHIQCLRCADCGQLLEVNCFNRDGDILCEHDFFRRYGKKCSICNEGISPRQQVRKVHERVYHISCLSCASCHRQLATGDLFYLGEDGRVMCKSDFEEGKGQAGYLYEPSRGDTMKEKRKRTFISVSQLNMLKMVYGKSPKPTLQERERISNETGLDMRVVQVWFQNRRAKDKRRNDRGKLQWLQQLPRTNTAQHTRSMSWSSGCLPEFPVVGDVREKENSPEEDMVRQVFNFYVSQRSPKPPTVEVGRLHVPDKLNINPGIRATMCASAPASPLIREDSGKGAPMFTFPATTQERSQTITAPPLDMQGYIPGSSSVESPPTSASEASGYSAPNTPSPQGRFLFDPEAVMAWNQFSPEEIVAACCSPGYGFLPK